MFTVDPPTTTIPEETALVAETAFARYEPANGFNGTKCSIVLLLISTCPEYCPVTTGPPILYVPEVALNTIPLSILYMVLFDMFTVLKRFVITKKPNFPLKKEGEVNGAVVP